MTKNEALPLTAARCLGLLLLLCLPAPGAAQLSTAGDVLLSASDFGGAPGDGTIYFGDDLAVGDFDGDGYQDLVVRSVQTGSASTRDSVYVAHGSASGLDLGSAVRLEAGFVGTLYRPTFAVGDFDGDRYDDLAVGSSGARVGGSNRAGEVTIYRGGPEGLSRVRTIDQDTPGVGGGVESQDEFGAALAAGDFDGDGYDDLAVGVPGESLDGVTATGAVQVFFGTRSGLTTAADLFFDQRGDFPGAPETGDRLGSTLAAGDFNRDGYEELVIGTPDEALGSNEFAGAVVVLPGSPAGPRIEGNYVLTQASGGESEEPFDRFGFALAVGDFDGDGSPDLAVGSPGESSRAGIVQVFYSRSGLVGAPSRTFRQGRDVPGTAFESDDRFGDRLASADFDLDGYDDLVVGARGEDIGNVNSAGAVFVLYGSEGGVTSSRAEVWTQDRAGVEGEVQADDQFGAALAVGDFDGGGPELAVGVPGETVGGASNAGRVQIFPNGISGAPVTGLVLSERFRVSVEWRDGTRSGFARDVLASGNSGIFSFFDTANWEVMVKVLDACAINGNYWLFFAGTTDVGFTLRAEDLQTGLVQTYTDPVGRRAETVTDTMAFPTCP